MRTLQAGNNAELGRACALNHWLCGRCVLPPAPALHYTPVRPVRNRRVLFELCVLDVPTP